MEEVLQDFLLRYRLTPHPALGAKSPTAVLMGRKVRTVHEAILSTKTLSDRGRSSQRSGFGVNTPNYAGDYRLDRQVEKRKAKLVEQEIIEMRKFYMHFRKALNSVLQPSHRFSSTASSKKGKANTAVYEENGLVTFINKYSERTSGNFHQILQDMANTYQQIVDFKSYRDSHLQTELFDPIHGSVLEELNNISKLKKDITDAEAEVNSARKGTEKNPQDQAAGDKLNRANCNLSQAKEKLQRALDSFKRDEANRTNMFIQGAQIQQDFYKKAADTFSQLVANLNTIKERSTNGMLDNSYNENTSYNKMKLNHFDEPDKGFGYTTTIKDFTSPTVDHKEMNGNCKCRALYDFTAEAEDDLSLRKNDEPTILEQVDDQWYYGELNGKKGHFPVEFVEKI
ncbi:hypothetical protein ACTXT7_008637 [Hymenolepis weldensis]